MKPEEIEYEDKPGYHRHSCAACGFIWEHRDSCKADDSAHVCPACGEPEQTWKYNGPCAPENVDEKV